MNADNPYTVLGLKPTATDAQIKAAYRRQANANHPDKHQDKTEVERNAFAQQFQRATWAYDILRDPQARAYFDKHGRIRSRVDLNQLNDVDQTLVQTFRSAILNVSDLRTTDVVKQMRLVLTDERIGLRSQIAHMGDNLKEFHGILDRFLRDDEVENVITESIRDDIAKIERRIEQFQKQANHLKACLDELQHWSYLTDEARRARVPSGLITAWATA